MQKRSENVSRKGAKHVLSKVEGAAMFEEERIFFAFLASWRDRVFVTAVRSTKR
jgi:hypothetical protein